MKLTADQIFNRERFEAWLVNQKPDRVFDIIECQTCVIASFVKETTFAGFVSVAGVHKFRTGKDECDSLSNYTDVPQWAQQLLRGVLFELGQKITTAQLLTAYNRQFNCDLLAMNEAVDLATTTPLNTKE